MNAIKLGILALLFIPTLIEEAKGAPTVPIVDGGAPSSLPADASAPKEEAAAFTCEDACLRFSDCASGLCENPDVNRPCLALCRADSSLISALEEGSCDGILALMKRRIPGLCVPSRPASQPAPR